LSFSSNVKNELCGLPISAHHCAAAEMAGLFDSCGVKEAGAVKIQTENAAAAKKFYNLLKKTFQAHGEISIQQSRQFKRTRLYTVHITDPGKLSEWMEHREAYIHNSVLSVLKAECCKKSYIRGAFIGCGSLSDPEKNYHLEFVCGGEPLSQGLTALLQHFGLRAKTIERKGHCIVYLKEGENIVDLLNIMGAHQSLLRMENLRIVKDMRNTVNRKVNCETANLSKTVTAAIKQVHDIKTIARVKGLECLSDQLREVAKVRLKYEEASLKEIGTMLSPPVGKSGVNHRLRKISEIADQLRRELL
jgi:DNA-binding protein WhiA